VSFTEARGILQRVLDSGDPDLPLSIRERVRGAREEQGLTPSEVAGRVGISVTAYDDVERIDDELLYVTDLGTLRRLAAALGVSAPWLLFGADPAEGEVARVTPAQVYASLDAHLKARDLTAEQFSERVDWDVAPLLRRPDSIWIELPAFAASEICSAVGLDWVGLLV
jgi:transcriptional regulator with XRE-family HTH domain